MIDFISLINNPHHVIIDKQPFPRLKSFLGVDYDTWTLISGIAVPLLSFTLGFLFSTLRDRIKERRDIGVSSESFFIWIKKSIKAAEVFLEEIKKRKTEAESLDNFQIKRPDYINLHLSRLILNQEKIYKAFVKYREDKDGKNSENYTTLIVNLDFLSDLQDIVYKNAGHMIDDFNTLFNQWNNFLRDLHRAKHNLIGKRVPFSKPSHLYSINALFESWYNSKVEGLTHVYKFLNTLEPFLKEMYAKDPSDDEVESLIFFASQTQLVYNQFISERDQYVSLLGNCCKQLEETIINLETASQKIEASKFLTW